MKGVCAGAFLLLSIIGFTQDSTGFQKALSRFTQAYYYMDSIQPTKNYFENMGEASHVLSFYFPEFKQARTEVKQRYPSKDEQWYTRKLADSVFHQFTNIYFWKGRENILSKHERMLKELVDKSCPCYSQKLEKEKRSLQDAVQLCDQETMKDAALLSRLSVYAQQLSNEEKLNFQKYISRYTYQHCPVINSYMTDILLEQVIDDNVSFVLRKGDNIDTALINYFRKNNKDSLLLVFPDYNKAATDFKKALPFYTKKNKSIVSEIFRNGKFEYARTFLEKKQILGQVRFSLILVDDAVRVVSFVFVPAEKIPAKEKKEILDSYFTELPPMEMLPGKN